MNAFTQKQRNSQSKDRGLSGRVILKEIWAGITWHKSSPQLVLFCHGATCNTLASPQNWACWGFEDGIEYALARKEEGSIAHILPGCQEALQSGKYTFHHEAVLRVIAHEMQVMIRAIQKVLDMTLKACVCFFYKIFIFSPNDNPSKSMKNVFYFI